MTGCGIEILRWERDLSLLTDAMQDSSNAGMQDETECKITRYRRYAQPELQL